MVDLFLKKRTLLGCLDASFDLFGKNIFKITRQVGSWMLAFAITSALLLTANDIHMDNSVYSLTLSILGCCALFLLDVKIKATFLSLLTCIKSRNLFKRILRTGLCGVCTMTLCCILFAVVNYSCTRNDAQALHPQNDNSFAIILVVNILLTVVLFLVMLPFAYSCTKYILADGARLNDVFGKDYLFGAKKIGFLIVLNVIIVLIMIAAMVLLAFPSVIILTAKRIDMYGVAFGDASGIPSFFGLLHFVSSVVMSLIMQYVSLWLLLILCYAYGSLESRNVAAETTNIKKQ